MIILCYMRRKKLVAAKTILLLILLNSLLIAFAEAVIRIDTIQKEQLLHEVMLSAGVLISQDIQRHITSNMDVTESLGTMLILNNYNMDEFDNWGELILSHQPFIFAIQLAPKGIVQHIYPLKGNEGALGHDLLLDENRDDGARKTISNRSITFVGPVKLIQNGKWAIIARKPIFIDHGDNEEFWGFSISLMLVEDLVDNQLREIEKEGLFFSLRGEDPDSVEVPIFYKSKNYDASDEVLIDIIVPNGSWEIGFNHPPITNDLYILFRIMVLIFGVLISMYIGYQRQLVIRQTNEILTLNDELKDLSLKDDLTGVGNRRASQEVLDRLIIEGHRFEDAFSIVLIDLDFFKSVNDECGHPAGDEFLKHFCKTTLSALRESDSLFRIGGDEFLIILPRTNLGSSLMAIEKLYTHLKVHPCKWEGKTIPISISTGIVEFKDGESLELLHKRGDELLYAAKNTGRNNYKY